jgi:polyisoprenyl-teichoic acid--peptidoglycan teichoic acid transferase
VQKPSRRRSLRPVKLLRRPTKPLLPSITPARMAAQRVLSQANSWRTYIIVIVLMLLIGGGGTALVFLRRTDQALANIQQSDPRANTGSNVAADPNTTNPVTTSANFVPSTLKEPFSVLLIGVDKRAESEAEGVRSDTIILVRVDPLAGWATMLSIPRDSVVQLPNGNYGKVNSAYAYGFYNAEKLYGSGTSKDAGGGAAAAQTIERFLNVKVDYTAQVDFQGFERLVDSVNGIVIDVKATLVDPEYPTENHGVERIYIAPGIQQMNGRTALVYARSRHSSNDFDRSKRQQQVLKAVLSAVRNRGIMDNVSLLPQWVGVLEQNVRTTLPISNISTMSDLAGIASRLDSNRISQLAINPLEVRVDNVIGSDIYWNPSDIASLVKRWQTGAGVAGIVNLQVLNGTTVSGLGGKVTTDLSKQGFATIDAGDGSKTATTMLYDIGDHSRERQRIIDSLGLSSAQISVNATRPSGASKEANLILVVGTDYRAAGNTP